MILIIITIFAGRDCLGRFYSLIIVIHESKFIPKKRFIALGTVRLVTLSREEYLREMTGLIVPT